MIQPAGSLVRERADQLGGGQRTIREVGTFSRSERAGAVDLARDVRGHGESVADSLLAGAFENLAMIVGWIEQLRYVCPGEPHMGAQAGMKHWIFEEQPIADEVLGPGGGISVEMNYSSPALAQIDMIDQREMVESKCPRAIVEKIGEFGRAGRQRRPRGELAGEVEIG